MSVVAIARPNSVSNSWRSEAGCVHDWFSYSGMPPLHDVRSHVEYARRLSQYIADPSTIRARTLDQYGEAPSLDVIREMRQHRMEIVSYRANNSYNYGIERERRRREAVAAKQVIKPKLEPDCGPDEVALPVVAARGLLLHTAVDVIDACAAACGISHGELIGSSRKKHFVRARNLAIAVLRARGNSYPNIGRFVRRADHTTIMHAARMFFERDIKDPQFAAAWAALAPCVTKACRSVAELDAVTAKRK